MTQLNQTSEQNEEKDDKKNQLLVNSNQRENSSRLNPPSLAIAVNKSSFSVFTVLFACFGCLISFVTTGSVWGVIVAVFTPLGLLSCKWGALKTYSVVLPSKDLFPSHDNSKKKIVWLEEEINY